MEYTLSFSRVTKFTGRNGYYNATALMITEYHPGNITFTPITGKGQEARCDIEVPIEDIPALIKALEKFK